jgi:hypothetical protein
MARSLFSAQSRKLIFVILHALPLPCKQLRPLRGQLRHNWKPMLRFYRVVATGFAILLLAACANTTVLEPQDQPLDTRQARLYFIRQPMLTGQLGSVDIKIDGKLIGSLGTANYIAADRSPGPHKITVYGVIDPTGFEADIQIEPGLSYYFELGPIVRMNVDLFTRDLMVTTGRPIPGRGGANSPLMFYALDPAAGAASVARLNARK